MIAVCHRGEKDPGTGGRPMPPPSPGRGRRGLASHPPGVEGDGIVFAVAGLADALEAEAGMETV